MEILICNSKSEIARIAANIVAAQIEERPRAVLGLATGSSPLALYAELINRFQRGAISFALTTMFLLDEYVDLPVDDPQSFRSCIRQIFTDQIDIEPTRVHGPEGEALNHEKACLQYEKAISQAGGIDLQILGIGSNGHIGFNEPGSSLDSRTRLITLTEQTKRDNAPYFNQANKMPTRALTQGIGTILGARHLLLIASGSKKRNPIKRAVEGPITAIMPASSIQLHPRVTVVLDTEAAAELEYGEYYRSAFPTIFR